MAVASAALGVVAWLVSCCGSLLGLGFFAIPIAIIGLILGVVGRSQIQQEPQRLTGLPLAILGIVLNAGLLLFHIAMIVLVFLGVGAAIALPIITEGL